MKTNPSSELDILSLPCLTLRDVVIFPGMSVPLFVGRAASMGAVDAAQERKCSVFVVAQKNAEIEDPARTDLYDTGCIADISQVIRLPDGTIKVLVEGRQRAVLDGFTAGRGFASAHIRPLESEMPDPKNPALVALARNVTHRFEEYVRLAQKIPIEAAMTIINTENPSVLSDAVAANLNIPVPQRQDLLSETSVEQRLLTLSEILEHEIDITQLENRIRGRVRKQMEGLQREHYLHEQVKAIQKELGKADGREEIEEMRAAIEKAGMPDEVKERALKELGRLEKMPPMTPETTVSRTYIQWLIDLPWTKRTEDVLDVRRGRKILDEDHYGLDKPKERILEYLAVCKLAGKIKGPILCFVGPPGVGKTSVGRSVARALGREFVRMSLGGVRDEAEIRGHRRTYVGALPGRILQLMAKAKAKNPVFLLDEVDKMSVDFRGDPSSALLEVLDPEQNHHFVDHYLEVGFDLSECLFITTANVRFAIPPPLLDRMEVIEIPGYAEPEKVQIARHFLVPKQVRENGLEKTPVRFSERVIRTLIRRYTNEAGVRDLERHIGKILRHKAKRISEGRPCSRVIAERSLSNILGVSQVHEKRTLLGSRPEPGAAAGLAWTETGGDVLLVESALSPGKGNIMLTGRLGEVMKESGHAAVTFARHICPSFAIKPDLFRKNDFHIHVSEGAIPKDGPSAGLTIAAAILSSIFRRPLPDHIAMTGEITLRGRVLPVGGLRSKLLAAQRYGITQVILPKENMPQISEIPPGDIEGLKLHYVESITEVLPILFPKVHVKRKAESTQGRRR